MVLITVDSLRADHLGCYGYFRDTAPAIDALAAECLVFERCLSPLADTLPAHLSLLTATHPDVHGTLASPRQGGRPFESTPALRSFAELLRDGGYRTAAFVGGPALRAAGGASAGFDVYVPPERAPLRADRTTDRALTWLKSMAEEPFLLWVHYQDPHYPYDPPLPEEGGFTTGARQKRLIAERGIADAVSGPGGVRLGARATLNAYDGEIRYTDLQLQRLLERLARHEFWKRTALVLVGDHGEALGQHAAFGHGGLWEEQLRVPCLLRLPGREPARIAEPITLMDVLPTLLGLVDCPGEPELLAQATGADALARDGPAPAILCRTAAHKVPQDETGYALTTAQWKLIRTPSQPDRLYHLGDDPFELSDVAAEHPRTAALLANELRARLAALSARTEPPHPAGDAPAGE